MLLLEEFEKYISENKLFTHDDKFPVPSYWFGRCAPFWLLVPSSQLLVFQRLRRGRILVGYWLMVTSC